ncbi:HlyD family secretion protein [Roseibium denhamense]|uniref:Multidrug resistance efflux pump n=1 Tax=Roseibium denhamense TaxID=76305 RepID=A0ABY1P9K3_9HYPH|nr:efflux RND transporter periplasmic adaptor subunit [Roseibium denhamense]MTI04498.1 HlyD family secretion protein [Roseibium denhamense]SMP28705.1 Multidrug resistance efflux pump [Roseibium denhamense]
MTIALLLLGFYAVFVWLIFYKFKLLKFNIAWGIVSFWIGFHVLFLLVVFLRFYAPYTIDGHVIRQTIQIAPRLPHPTLLTEVFVSQNQPVKKGEKLYQFDTTLYEAQLAEAQANLVEAEQNALILQENIVLAQDALLEAQANETFAEEQVKRYTDLVPRGGARQETLDQWTAQLASAKAQTAEAQANVKKAQLAAEAQIDGVNAQVAAAQAQVDQAQYYVDQTTIYAPEDGKIISQQARPGLVVGGFRIAAIAAFVADADPYFLATFYQEHLKFVEPGQPVEVALDIYPGQIFAGTVKAIWEGTGQGQIKPSGTVPNFLFMHPQGRFAVEIDLDQDPALKRFPGGAHGAVAIYTSGGGAWVTALRKINLRLYAWINFIVPFDV